MTRRILFIDHAAVLGGAELSLLDIARHFKDHCTVVLFEPGPFEARLQQDGVKVRVCPAPRIVQSVTREGGGLRDLMAAPGVLLHALQIARQARPFDLVYTNSQKAFVIGAIAGMLARRPVIWHLRDILTADHFSAGHRRLVILLANRLASKIIANSEATAQAFLACGGAPGKLVVVHNSIDAAPIQNVSAAEVEAARAALGVGDQPVVGVFSRLAPWKGQHILLEALRIVPELQAILVGGALFQDEAVYEAQLKAQVRDEGLAERVHFLGFRNDVPVLLQLVDVVAHTSIAPEPFGRVVVEGMLAGRPVVASRAGGVPEIITHEETGLLVDPGDPVALAASLRRVLSTPDQARAMALRGRASAEARFSLDRLLREVEAVLDTVY